MLFNVILGIILIYCLFVISKSIFTIRFYKESELLYNPNFKIDRITCASFFIPYYGSAKLMEMQGNNILKYISYIIGIFSILACINTVLFRFIIVEPSGFYLLISLWINVLMILLNITGSILNCLISAKTVQAQLSLITAIIPPVGYYCICSIVHNYFVLNKDELRGTFDI